MAKKTPTLYSISKTFVWFAIMSIILTLSLAGIVYTDYKREWKTWQKQFTTLKLQKTQTELQTAQQKIDQKRVEELRAEHKKAEDTFKSNKKAYEALRSDIEKLETRAIKVKTQYQDLKSYEDSYKYYTEEYRQHHDRRANDYEKQLKAVGPRLEKLKTELDLLESQKEAKERELAKFTENEKSIQKQIDELLDEKTRVETKISRIKPSLAKDILNAPMLDFIAPSLKVQQVVLDNLYDDYHFAKTQKVDRCMTCHMGIDQKGFEDAPQPFRTHPNLDLFVGSNSKHAIEKFGCTTCHGGNGHSVSFKDTAHTPNDEAQAAEWKKKYAWKELEKWDHKMLPSKHMEAACAKCHSDVVEVPKADHLNNGRKLAETYGCFGCHKIQGFQGRWKVGPSLEHISSKLDPEWVKRWLADPTAFRPNTKMPRVFHLSNTSSPEDKAKNDASIEAITAYLFQNSTPVQLRKAPVKGAVARGETLVKDLGCLGCHSITGTAAGDHGPELTGLGSKVTEDWLFTWLKDPKHYLENSRMPNLRLSDQEAADITAYLLSQTNDAFENRPVPKASEGMSNEMILKFMEGTMRRSEAEAALGKMSREERLQYLGKKSVLHQGCFGCHDIKGFEDAKPIGVELSDEGRKDIHMLDFGFIKIDKTRDSFIHQKLKEPRIFDQGKIKAYHDKLRMPQFKLTDTEIEDLTTFILSLTQEQIPLEMQKRLDSKEHEIERGRLLVAKFNCNGCHELDGKPGLLRELAEDKGAAPPIIDGEGAKVQEKWLHEFLHAPTPIREWLKVRMPSFEFSEAELKNLVIYFDRLSKEEISYNAANVPPTTNDKLVAGKALFDKLQCAKCHEVNPSSAAMGASFLAPNLELTKHRLKAHWVKDWIRDPQALQEGTMMPAFFPDGQTPLPDILGGDAEKQIEAIRDYLYTYEKSGESNTVAK